LPILFARAAIPSVNCLSTLLQKSHLTATIVTSCSFGPSETEKGLSAFAASTEQSCPMVFGAYDLIALRQLKWRDNAAVMLKDIEAGENVKEAKTNVGKNRPALGQ